MSRRRLGVLTSHPIQYQAPLFRALARRPELDLTVLFCSDDGARPYRDPGFQTVVAWDVPLLDGYRSVLLPRGAWGLGNPSVVGALRRERFDALVVHGWAHPTNWLAYATAAALGLPLLIRGESNGLREARGWRRRAKRVALGWLFRRAAAFLAIGTLNRRFYEAWGVTADRIFWAPYAVDNAFFQQAAAALPSRAALRAQHAVPAEHTVFLFCGKLTPAKRPLDALAAYQRLARREQATLLYVGDGPLRRDIETASAGDPNVRITGFRNQSALPALYALADVLVLPSAYEPWGLVVNEALNFGLAVITSDQVGAAADLVRADEGGHVVPVGDVAALTGAMEACHADGAPGRRSGGKRVIDEWGIEQCADGIVDAVTSLARRG